MKYKITKDSVEETLIIPLYSRVKAAEIYPSLYADETSKEVLEQVDYDFSDIEKASKKAMNRFGYLEVAMRQNDLAYEIRDYLATHPRAAVVNLGCGLDDLGRKCDNGTCRIYNLDFENVIQVRNQILPSGEREENIAADLMDMSWLNKIDARGGAVFFASGVFYYFLKEQVQTLVSNMAERFPGGKLVFDAVNQKAVKMIRKTWLKKAKIQDVGAYFAVSGAAKELMLWSERIRVSSKGYMLGYSDLKDPSVDAFFRFLARIGDRCMKMQIVRIDFKEEAKDEEKGI